MNKIIASIFMTAGLVSIASAAERYDYAARWKAWDIDSRTAYVAGVTEAIPFALFTTAGSLTNKPPAKEVLAIALVLKCGYPIERKKIVEVITDIYQDPANSYIDTTRLFLFAQDKIQGKDISKALETARRQAYDGYKPEQKIE